jgi:hypothetical protein
MSSLFYTGHMMSYFERNFFGCITYNITYVYKLFHIFLTHRSAACNNRLDPQLVTEYLLSDLKIKLASIYGGLGFVIGRYGKFK